MFYGCHHHAILIPAGWKRKSLDAVLGRWRAPRTSMRGSCAGLPNQELRCDEILFAHAVFTQLSQSAEREVGDLSPIDANRRERRMSELREGNVVEADNRDIFRDAQSAEIQSVQCPDRRQIVRSHDGGGLRGDQIQCGAESTLGGVFAVGDEIRGNEQSAGVCGLLETMEANLCGFKALRTADESDAAVAKGDEVLESFSNAASIVDHDVAHAVGGGASIEHDERYSGATDFFDKIRAHLGGHDGKSIYLALKQAVHTLSCPFGIVFGVAEDHLVLFVDCDCFEGFHQIGKKWIRNVGDDEREKLAFA